MINECKYFCRHVIKGRIKTEQILKRNIKKVYGEKMLTLKIVTGPH